MSEVGDGAMDQLLELRNLLVKFREERDWEQFHTLKNLCAALSIEAAELQELTLWKKDSELTPYGVAGHTKGCVGSFNLYYVLFHDVGSDRELLSEVRTQYHERQRRVVRRLEQDHANNNIV